METLLDNLSKEFETIKIDKTFIEIKTNLEFKKGINLRVFIKKIEDKYILTDNKNTLRYMNTLYNLSSKDVIQCVNDIVNHYKLRIDKGEIFGEVTENNIKRKFLEFISCLEMLANMFLFFDEPTD